jgi:hypothetical protein
MKASLGRAGLISHVDGTIAAAPTDAAWAAEVYNVLNLLHATIDEDVTDMVLSHEQTTHQLWLAIHELFFANKASKAIYLDNKFCQLDRGAYSITKDCRRQKQLMDSLADNDSAVSAHALILNTLHGLGPRFATATTIISMMDPLPSFIRTQSMLLVEEMQQLNTASKAANTTLVTHTCPPPPTCTSAGCRGDSFNPGTGKPKNTYNPKNKNGGRHGGGAPERCSLHPSAHGCASLLALDSGVLLW